MTERVHSLTVVLDEPIREDDAGGIIDAIRRIRGVASVSAEVADLKHYAAVEVARHELRKRIADVLWPEDPLPSVHR